MSEELESAIKHGSTPARRDELDLNRDGNPTEQKILLGAIDALGRRGSRSLSMSDVALAANVSRATLYRYFRTKEAVLEAVSEYISTTFMRGADRIARTVKEPTERLKAIMSLQIKLATEEFITRITEVEPGLVLKFLADHYERHVDAMRKVLDPLYDQIEATTGFEVDRDVLSGSVLRMQLSLVIVPPDERWRTSPDVLANMLTAFMREARAPVRKPRRRRDSK
ncbi:MAG TPA: helix-turn-helix domain-containing protein [Steroidobacteraceae bacterium]|jgi:AcrR family transcriptional regulator|nr:helix-turn-helix domain-containing protein [Steroidobacteraceae bacterium]